MCENFNNLFNPKMFDLLYARDMFGALKTEGSFSAARVMDQFRQYYMRMMDLNDSYGMYQYWEKARERYISYVTSYAMDSVN